MTYLLIICGLALLLGGANYLVESSVAIAKRAKISNFVIGLTIIGFGTSAPELFVSISSALNGHADMSMGNILGSNICNVLLILGITALIKNINIPRKRDTLWSIGAAILLTALCYIPDYRTPALARIGGIILLTVFATNMWYVIRDQSANSDDQDDDNDKENIFARLHVILLIFIALTSLAALIFGGDIFLDNTIILAKQFGMSDYVISCTIVAVGTSMPELITCVVAALKGNPDIALGNVLGSNVFNILLILGITSTIAPFGLSGVNVADFAMLIFSALLVFIFNFTCIDKYVDRKEGAFCVVLYIAYTIYLLFLH